MRFHSRMLSESGLPARMHACLFISLGVCGTLKARPPVCGARDMVMTPQRFTRRNHTNRTCERYRLESIWRDLRFRYSRDRIRGINIGFPDLGECECKRRPIGRPADAQIAGRRSVTWRRIMKTLIAALALAFLIAAPAFAPSATAATYAGRNASQSGQNYNGYYRGYPLEDWYRADSW